MNEPEAPKTDAELVKQLRALYDASDYSGGARDDFWDMMSFYTNWIVALAERGAKKNNPARANGGHARMAALSPEKRTEIAKKAAAARWHPDK